MRICHLTAPLPIGSWITKDPAFTLQSGTQAGDVSWGDSNDKCPHVLQCDIPHGEYVANDIWNHGHHLGNSMRLLSDMDPHLLLNALLPPLLFESAFAIDWHIFSKVCSRTAPWLWGALCVARAVTTW